MSDANVARALTVSGDERGNLQSNIDAMLRQRYYIDNVFHNPNVVQTKQIMPGEKQRDFPILGDSPEEAEHHVGGTFIESGTILSDQVPVTIDDDLIKALRIPIVDETLSRWDLIGPSMKTCIRKVIEKLNRRICIVALQAARTAAVSNIHPGGTVVERVASDVETAYAMSDTGADAIMADIKQAVRGMKTKDVPCRPGSLICYTTHYMADVLTESRRLMNRDYAAEQYGSIVKGAVGMFNNCWIVPQNYMPDSVISDDLSKYNGDFAVDGSYGQPVALLVSTDDPNIRPVGEVTAGGFRNKVWYDENRNCTLTKCQTFKGFGPVSPWVAAEIRVTTS